ncbi:hypothetical protein D9C73_010628 [Collichthys lucidus]|uniref:Uncharacterized protein n=1 Tax=Collichthys lucidus TaxID=240159 RepID=A0A4U5UP04_COLLU|nr:hypothetical protein D9C73_028478 [Collichthys lucidus]TKS76529.1 hypothetical protein D9C73_010618 [Collichthys lucidus]TKS76539.1 hypothetical protein D9C73_010628 [Collichthys lucidus]
MTLTLPDQQYLSQIKEFLHGSFDGFQLDSSYQQLSTNLVFHTWVAYWGVGIPDGTRPFNGKLLDYVSKIKRQAVMLEAQHIPNAIVYSRLQLPKEEEMTLLANFADEGNIVLLCLEDMTYSIPPSSYSNYYSTTFKLLDHLRLAVINHAPAVLEELRRKALREHKDQYVSFLDSNGGNAIMYADIDIVFTADRVPVVCAKNGMCSYPEPNDDIFIYGDMSDEVDISPELMKKITDHSSVFERDWEAITNYIMRDKAYDVATAITRELGIKKNPCVARGENCMLLVAYSSVPLFRTCVSGGSMVVDLHPTDTEFYRENHTLIYLQLIPYMKHMSDCTWV